MVLWCYLMLVLVEALQPVSLERYIQFGLPSFIVGNVVGDDLNFLFMFLGWLLK